MTETYADDGGDVRKECIVSGLAAIVSGIMVGALMAMYGFADVHEDLGLMAVVVVCLFIAAMGFSTFLYCLSIEKRLRSCDPKCPRCGMPIRPWPNLCDEGCKDPKDGCLCCANCGYDPKGLSLK